MAWSALGLDGEVNIACWGEEEYPFSLAAHTMIGIAIYTVTIGFDSHLITTCMCMSGKMLWKESVQNCFIIIPIAR